MKSTEVQNPDGPTVDHKLCLRTRELEGLRSDVDFARGHGGMLTANVSQSTVYRHCHLVVRLHRNDSVQSRKPSTCESP